VARAVQHELVDRETRLPHARPGPARARSLEERGLNAVKLVSQTPDALQSQLVAEVLAYFRHMTQVVIGLAISSDEVAGFLTAAGIGWTD